jgi:hypothetical protein
MIKPDTKIIIEDKLITWQEKLDELIPKWNITFKTGEKKFE